MTIIPIGVSIYGYNSKSTDELVTKTLMEQEIRANILKHDHTTFDETLFEDEVCEECGKYSIELEDFIVEEPRRYSRGFPVVMPFIIP